MLDLSSTYPWSDVQSTVIDGQTMVKIPKFYIKTDVLTFPSIYAGKRAWMISGENGDGYRVHPAFVKDGEQIDCFYVGAYEASIDEDGKAQSLSGRDITVNDSPKEAIAACEARGEDWHLLNIYERSAITMLALAELGESNIEASSSMTSVNSSGTSSDVWRGIHEFFGNSVERLDGIMSDKNGYCRIFKNDGSGEYATTDVLVSKLNTQGIVSKTGDGYNMADLFSADIGENALDFLTSGNVCCMCDCRESGTIGFRLGKY